MVTSVASISVLQPKRYAKQLTRHMSKKVETAWDDEKSMGAVTFNDAHAHVILFVKDKVLKVNLEADTTEKLAYYERVIGRHLVRFGFQESIVVTWVRPQGPGSTQTSEDDEHKSSGK